MAEPRPLWNGRAPLVTTRSGVQIGVAYTPPPRPPRELTLSESIVQRALLRPRIRRSRRVELALAIGTCTVVGIAAAVLLVFALSK